VSWDFPGKRQLAKGVTNRISSRALLEKAAIESESLVDERDATPGEHPSTAEHEEFCGNLAGPPAKAKDLLPPIVN
jgi:hypothetical protein